MPANKKIFLTLPILFLVVLFLISFFLFGQKNIFTKTAGVSVSKDILFLTQPVYNIAGKVDKIQDDSLIVSQKFTLQTPVKAEIMINPDQPPVLPTPVSKEITFKIKVDANTQINRPLLTIPYLLTTPTPPPTTKLTVKDIRVGEFVNISTATDLRTLKKAEFIASSIQLPSIVNWLSGTIDKISGKTILLKATPSQPAYPDGLPADLTPPQEKTYTIEVANDTEISRYAPAKPTEEEPESGPQPPVAEKLSLADLGQGLRITVYTNIDVTSVDKFPAFRIEPSQILRELNPTPTLPQTTITSPPVATQSAVE